MINRLYILFIYRIVAAVTGLFFAYVCDAQHAAGIAIQPNVKASWIAHPTANPNAYGVFHFRKQINVDSKPASFFIHISADQRFRFFVNGQSVSFGPARSDVQHWHYQTIDIASHLIKGNNTLAAEVWNDGEYSAWAQLSYQTGLLIVGATASEGIANTDTSWRVIENMAYMPQSTIAHNVGAFEQVLAQRYPYNWEKINYDDSHWLTPKLSEKIVTGVTDAAAINKTSRILMPSTIPVPEETLQRIPAIRDIAGFEKVSNDFLKGKGSLAIQPWKNVTLLLDQTYLTTAFVELLVSGGKGAKITLTYAESPVDDAGNKGNRNEVAGKKIIGDYDVFIADGGQNRLYRPLYYRTYRYILLQVENHQEALEIKDVRGYFTAYPFQQNATFNSSDTTLNNIFKVGWRTARLCAFETYMDCPYYEQLQYVGDTRIQALISLYVSGDDRLMKNAIDQIRHSMLPEGITQSRYPSSNLQVIPPFSLFWISMIHDFWMHKKDDAFIQQQLPAIQEILKWHQQYINQQGMLGKMPYWNFVDWATQWPWLGQDVGSGTPSLAKDGNSSILTLQFVMALQKAADLSRYFKLKNNAANYSTAAASIRNAVYRNCWDAKKNLLADTPDKTIFSQHAQALGVLTETFSAGNEVKILQQTKVDTSLIQCTYYYRFYLLQALKKAGMGNSYTSNLGPWITMLNNGLTTFAESPEPTRSDCHAWSASPCYDLLATVCGITSTSPGFASIQIKPALGNLTFCEASMPHPLGAIAVKYEQLPNKQWKVFIDIPQKVKGNFIWGSKQIKLKEGENYFTL